MGAGRLLRDLDRRVLPPLARGIERVATGGRRPRLVTSAVFVSVTAVLLAGIWYTGREPAPPVRLGDVARVGVVNGQSIPGYVASSRTELAKLVAADGEAPAPTYALVTLKAYLAPDRLAPVLAGVSVAEVYARVPLPEKQTEIVHIPAATVPDDVVRGMLAVADRKDQEAARLRELSGKLSGHGREESRLRGVYTDGAQLAAAEAAAYRSLSFPKLYAAVVRGLPAELERVSRRPEVRAVDPAPEVRSLDRAVFLPPLPEQADVVRPPATRPARPSPAPETTRPARPEPTHRAPETTPPVSPDPGAVVPPPSPSDQPTSASPPETLSPSSTDQTATPVPT